jgi:hypothetical protein
MGWIAGAAGAFFGIFLMFWVGFTTQPWSPWWISGGSQDQTVAGGGDISLPSFSVPSGGALPPISDAPAPPVTAGHVSDVQRFQLIEAAGASPQVAIVMTALSIAEDGSGDPSIVGPPNRDHSVDNGLWQVNSGHIGQCGITSQQWLFDPMNNARAAMCILGPGLNYCAWSTFEASCGAGHTGAYRAFIAGATFIAQGQTWQH